MTFWILSALFVAGVSIYGIFYASSQSRKYAMFHRVSSVHPLPENRLLVRFMNSTVKKYNMNALIENNPAFFPLRESALFNLVRVDAGGYGISWNDDLDLSSSELWEHGEE